MGGGYTFLLSHREPDGKIDMIDIAYSKNKQKPVSVSSDMILFIVLLAGGMLRVRADGDGGLLGVRGRPLGCCCSGPCLPLPALRGSQVERGESFCAYEVLVVSRSIRRDLLK